MIRGLINDPKWLYDYYYDEENRLERIIFFNKELVKLLTLFLSVLILDATYKTNRFNLPLINICTMTATNETLLIGQAFVTHEEIGDYEWVL
jgi:MULE transposase domain